MFEYSRPNRGMDKVIYIAGWRMLSVRLTAASSCYYSLGGLCGPHCHHRRRQQPLGSVDHCGVPGYQRLFPVTLTSQASHTLLVLPDGSLFLRVEAR